MTDFEKKALIKQLEELRIDVNSEIFGDSTGVLEKIYNRANEMLNDCINFVKNFQPKRIFEKNDIVWSIDEKTNTVEMGIVILEDYLDASKLYICYPSKQDFMSSIIKVYDANDPPLFATEEEAKAYLNEKRKTMYNQKHIKLWVDDVRPAPYGYNWVKTTNEALKFILASTIKSMPNCANCKIFEKCQKEIVFCDCRDISPIKIDELNLDHDAGDYVQDGGDYIKILDRMEQEGINDIPIHIHSMNPVGVQNMRTIIQHNNWKEI